MDFPSKNTGPKRLYNEMRGSKEETRNLIERGQEEVDP